VCHHLRCCVIGIPFILQDLKEVGGTIEISLANRGMRDVIVRHLVPTQRDYKSCSRGREVAECAVPFGVCKCSNERSSEVRLRRKDHRCSQR
jgi:hypothetical protein